MTYLNPLVLDNGLGTVVSGSGRRLDICRLEPASYAQAINGTTHSVGNKTGLTIPAPVDMSSPLGRRVVVPAITDGTVTYTSGSAADDAEFWALTDPANSRLIAVGNIGTPTLAVSGSIFTTPAFNIGLPYPA